MRVRKKSGMDGWMEEEEEEEDDSLRLFNCMQLMNL
jgi:hypothetical protein